MKNIKKVLFICLCIFICLFNNLLGVNADTLCTVDTAEQLAKILYHETGFGNFVGDEDEYFFVEATTAGVIFNNMMRNGGNTYLEKIYNLTDNQYGGYSSYRDKPFSSNVSSDRQGELLYIAELVLTGKYALPDKIIGQASCKCLLGTEQCEGVNPELSSVDCKMKEGWAVYWTHVKASEPKALFDIYFGYSKYLDKPGPFTITGASIPSTDPAYFRRIASNLRKSDYSSYTSTTVCDGVRSDVKLADLIKNNGSNAGNGNDDKVEQQTKPKVPTSSFFLIKDNCLNPDVLRIVRFVLVLIDVVRYVVPMALIVYGALDFSKAAVAGDEKGQKEKVSLFVKRIINAVALFLVPVIVEFVIVFLGDLASGVNFTDCIQNATKDKIAELQVELDKKREEIEKEYETSKVYTKKDYANDYEDLQQYDDRWTNHKVCKSEGTLGSVGSGYVSYTMMLRSFGNKDVTPIDVIDTICSISTAEGIDFILETGAPHTSIFRFKEVNDKFGVEVEDINYEQVEDALRDGKSLLVLTPGHWISILDIDENDQLLVGDSFHGVGGKYVDTKEALYSKTAYREGYEEEGWITILAYSNKVKEEVNNYDHTVFIGDSRTVGMCYDVKLGENENCELAKSGMGYKWLTSDEVKSDLDKILVEHKNSYVVINMGTNSGLSTNEGKDYANYYNELSKKYPKSKIVAVSVTQVIPELAKKNGLYAHTYLDSNSVNNFNKGLKSNLNSNVKYCDVYSALEKRGYNTPDGVHYAKETNEVIYEEIQKCLK